MQRPNFNAQGCMKMQSGLHQDPRTALSPALMSEEGSWLRIGVFDKEKNEVRIVPVYIPFGQLIVRHNTLPHSGNYGRPGNTRVHCVLKLPGEKKTNTSELGYVNLATNHLQNTPTECNRIQNANNKIQRHPRHRSVLLCILQGGRNANEAISTRTNSLESILMEFAYQLQL